MILITSVKMDVMLGLSVWLTGDECKRVRQRQGHARKTSALYLTCSLAITLPKSQTDIRHILKRTYTGSVL